MLRLVGSDEALHFILSPHFFDHLPPSHRPLCHSPTIFQGGYNRCSREVGTSIWCNLIMFYWRWGPGVSREGVEAALDEARALFLLDPTIKVGNQIDFADRGALDTVLILWYSELPRLSPKVPNTFGSFLGAHLHRGWNTHTFFRTTWRFYSAPGAW